MKTIYLVRHAKSSWKSPHLSDRERPLNRRGKESAPLMAERLYRAGAIPELIIASPAKRAQMTAKKLAVGMGYEWASIGSEDKLYFQGVEGILQTIRSISSSINSVMLVGHNPDLTDVLNGLAGYVTGNMPTCAIATLAFPAEWQTISLASAKLVDYDYPKNKTV